MRDLIIIGGGPAGYACAIRAAQLGKKVALIEKGKIGGVCLNIGCIPTKSYLHLTKVLKKSEEVQSAGISFSPPQINLREMKRWVFLIVERLSKGIEGLLKSFGVQLISDEGEILPHRQVRLKKRGEILTSEAVVIATGSRPACLKTLPFDGKRIINSDLALMPEELPKSLIIIGAGAIGLELATFYSRLKTKVAVIEIMNQILPGIDQEIASRLQRIMEKEGIRFYLTTEILDCAETSEGLRIRAKELTSSNEFFLKGDKILVAVGRIPNTENFALEKKNGFIKTDVRFQTNLTRIYAIGDCSGPPLLAHKAFFEGKELAEIIAGERAQKRESLIPNCIYTDPEIATIGFSEEKAKLCGFSPKVYKIPLAAIGRAHTLNRIEGLAKAVISEDKKLIGLSLLCPHASELISEATLLIQEKIGLNAASAVIHPHPTLSEILLETLEKALGKSIHSL